MITSVIVQGQDNQKDISSTGRAQRVFVVYGRNLAARDAMFTFLRSIGLQPVEWSHAVGATGKASPYIGEVLEAAFNEAQAVVVLMTPDEIACLRDEFASQGNTELQPAAQARPNVLFEAGMAMGRAPNQTVLVELGTVRLFSDVAGVHTIKMTDEPEKRKQLADRLQVAGCDVDLSGEDWMRAGEFVIPPELGAGSLLGKEVPASATESQTSNAIVLPETWVDEIAIPQETLAGVNVENLLTNVQSHEIDSKQAAVISKFFSDMPQKSADHLAACLFARYVKSTTSESERNNIRLLFPELWICISDNQREHFGMKCEQYVRNGDINKNDKARSIIELVDGGQYLTESIREAEISRAIDNLLSTHRDFDNFRTEPPAARELGDTIKSLKIVPESLHKDYVAAIVEVFLAGHYGVAKKAAPIYRTLIDNFTKRQARLALISMIEPHIASRLSSEKPQEQFSKLAKMIRLKLNLRYRELLDTIELSSVPLHEVINDPEIKHKIKTLREDV